MPGPSPRARSRADRQSPLVTRGPDGQLRPNRKLPFILIAVVLVIGLFKISDSHSHPFTGGLSTSCTTPAFATNDMNYSAGESVKIALTGPSTDMYAVYLDIASVSLVNGTLTAVPLPGVTLANTQVLLEAKNLPKCFGVESNPLLDTTPAGPHTLSLYAVTGTTYRKVQTLQIAVR